MGTPARQTSRTDHEGQSACVISRYMGLPAAPILIANPSHDARLGISRISCGARAMPCGQTIPTEDSFVVMLHLAEYRYHQFWSRGGRPILAKSYPKDSITIVNLKDDLSANVGSELDAMSFYIPRATLDCFAQEANCGQIADLTCVPGMIDPVLASLGAALLPALTQPATINTLFVDRLCLALQAHVAATYGGVKPPLHRSGGLSRDQETRVKEYLVVTDTTDLSLAGAAAICGLSRSYFSKAFKATTGRSPHRWLLEHRIEQSKRMLRTQDSIAGIALECGFTDQSHFTRVFAHIVGVPPGVWRRHLGV